MVAKTYAFVLAEWTLSCQAGQDRSMYAYVAEKCVQVVGKNGWPGTQSAGPLPHYAIFWSAEWCYFEKDRIFSVNHIILSVKGQQFRNIA